MEGYVKTWIKDLTDLQNIWDNENTWPDDLTESVLGIAWKALKEVTKLRDRLQFDPGGSDKIDELECAMDFMHHNEKPLEQDLDDFKKAIVRIRREFVHRMQSEPSSEVINWMANEMMELSNKCHAKWPSMVDEELLQECAEDAAKSFDSDPKNKVFNSAGFSQAFCKRTGVKGVIDGGIVKGILVGRPWVNYDGGSYWALVDV